MIILVIVIVVAGAMGWNLGKGSAANSIQEKPSAGGGLSARSTNDLYSQKQWSGADLDIRSIHI